MSAQPEMPDEEFKKRIAAIEFARGSIANLAPGRNMAAELIADRRAEARTEQIDTGADHGGGAE
jgi:hypothetical protein